MIQDSSSSTEGQIGRHVNRFIPPDVCYVKISGDVDDEDGRELNRQQYEIGKDIDGLFFLCDLAELESVSPGTRKGAAEVQKNLAIAGIVIVKAPLKARIFAKLLLTASSLLRGEKMPVMFVDTEEEAWVWIERRRKEYHAKRGRGAAAAEPRP
jgi:hypothetical protein